MNNSEAVVKADYADLGVTCGYIGNIYQGPVRDDRHFMVFTKVKSSTGERQSISVFSVPYGHKGIWNEPVDFNAPAIRTKLDALRNKVASGEFFVPTN